MFCFQYGALVCSSKLRFLNHYWFNYRIQRIWVDHKFITLSSSIFVFAICINIDFGMLAEIQQLITTIVYVTHKFVTLWRFQVAEMTLPNTTKTIIYKFFLLKYATTKIATMFILLPMSIRAGEGGKIRHLTKIVLWEAVWYMMHGIFLFSKTFIF